MHKIEKWLVTTEPTVEPVSLADMKLHLRVDCTADDDLITSLIVAARQWCEDYEHRAYITQTITAKLDYLPSQIILPKPRLQSVTSITYTDTAEAVQTLNSSLYDVDTYREPGQVTRGYNENYPSVLTTVNSVTIVYVAGYGDAATDVPDKTISAIKLLCAHLYEHRMAVSDLSLEEIPLGVKSLLNDRRWTV
jgi:uncharacterized phiE125 gp8 family phage protein